MTKSKFSKKRKEEFITKFENVPTQEEVFEKLKASQERMVRALAGALSSAPDDPQIRNQLLEAVDKAVKLRTKIYGMIGEKPPKITLSQTDLTTEENRNPKDN